MDQIRRKVALVTGGAGGIGKAVCKKLLEQDMVVVACDQDREGMGELLKEVDQLSNCTVNDAKNKVVPYICDLRKEDEILSMFKNIKEHHGELCVCVAAAGLNLDAPLLSGDSEMWRIMVDVNLMASAICAREAIGQMRSHDMKRGHVVLIGSMAGHRVRASKFNKNFYCATKYALTALTEGLRNELVEVGSTIRVSQISPGLVETPFNHKCYASRSGELEDIYRNTKALQAEDVAEAVMYALSAPPHVQVHDILLRPSSMP